MTNILYVCEANINRSRAAECITKHILRERRIECIEVSSAGFEQHYADTFNIIQALTANGYDVPEWNGFTQVTPELLSQQDYVLTFKNRKRERLKRMNPDIAEKVHTLTEFAGFPDREVFDPGKYIDKRYWFPFLGWIPGLGIGIHALFGRADSRDSHGVVSVHKRLVKNIESYVRPAVNRILAEVDYQAYKHDSCTQ